MEKKSPNAPRRTLRIDLMTIFLILFVVTFSLVIWYTSYESTESIHTFSRQEIARVSEVVEDKARHFEYNALTAINVASELAQVTPHFTIADPEVREYLLLVISYNKNLSKLYMADLEGNIAVASKLSLTTLHHYRNNPNRRLPDEATYAFWMVINNPLPKRFTITYLDKDLRVVGKENVDPNYNPTTRPWYIGALKTDDVYWTPIYQFYPSNDYGVTAAKKFYDPEGNPTGVVGADLSFLLLSRFIENQKVGKNGYTFLYDIDHQFLLPTRDESQAKVDRASIVKTALKDEKGQGNVVHVKGSDGINYLVGINSPKLFGATDWKTVIMVPTEYYFSYLYTMQRDILIFIAIMLALAIICVIFFARRISKPITVLAKEIDQVRQLELESETRVISRVKEIFLLDQAIDNLRKAVRSFVRYVPRDLVKSLLSHDHDIVLGGESTHITVLFTDIASFSTIASSVSPEQLSKMMSEYFQAMTEIVLSHGGTIDKYIGDSLMAFWGAPEAVADQQKHACSAVLECRRWIDDFNRRQGESGKPLFATRFGLNCGNSIVGNVGTKDRMNYTAIGDVVNTASRLEHLNKDFSSTISMSESIYNTVKEAFVCRPLAHLAVKGRKEKTMIYELLEETSRATEDQKNLARDFGEALKNQNAAQFKALLEKYPDDGPTKYYAGCDGTK